MKRYKECALVCNKNQQPEELLDIVMQVSEKKGYKIDRYSSIGKRDSLAVYLIEVGLPYSRLIVHISADKDIVSVVNIVPMPESGVSHLSIVEYNRLLDTFRDKVFGQINQQWGNIIKENSEDYEISEIIPLSFVKLDTWLSNYPLSAHPLDRERWYDFVIALHTNKEHLSLNDFEEYIKENYEWEEKVVEEFSLKLESQLELLEYYDKHR